jgi:hypothetical protein
VSLTPLVFEFTPINGVTAQIVSYLVPNGAGQLSFTSSVSSDDSPFYSVPSPTIITVTPLKSSITVSAPPASLFAGKSFPIQISLPSTPRSNVIVNVQVDNGASVQPAAAVLFISDDTTTTRTVTIQTSPIVGTGRVTVTYSFSGNDAALYNIPSSSSVIVEPKAQFSVQGIPSFINAGSTLSLTISVNRVPSSVLSFGVTPVVNGVRIASLRSTVNFFNGASTASTSVDVPSNAVNNSVLSFYFEVSGADSSYYLFPTVQTVTIRQ